MIAETFVKHYMYIYWQQCSWLQQHSYMYICTHTYVYRIYIYIRTHAQIQTYLHIIQLVAAEATNTATSSQEQQKPLHINVADDFHQRDICLAPSRQDRYIHEYIHVCFVSNVYILTHMCVYLIVYVQYEKAPAAFQHRSANKLI